jgi:hypothetical protein
MLPAVEEMLGQACGVTRGLLWRGLGIEPLRYATFFPGLRSDTFWTRLYYTATTHECYHANYSTSDDVE